MTEAAVVKIHHTIEQLRAMHSNVHGSQEQKWIQDRIADDELKQIVLKLSIIAFHILSALEKSELTGIELAEKLCVTRGGITRAAKNLSKYQLIKLNKHPDNQKNIYYALTDRGRQIALVHDKMHASIKKSIVESLTAKYSKAELEMVAEFLEDLYKLEKQFN